MARPDLSQMDLDELTALIDEATKLREKKVAEKRADLQRQLDELDGIGKQVSSGKIGGPVPKKSFRLPNGDVVKWAGRGQLPAKATELGVTKEQMKSLEIEG